MPWQEVSTVTARCEFVKLAMHEGCDIQELCKRFGISRQAGYKWIRRFREQGVAGLHDRSRRPRRSPGQTAALLEGRILNVRDKHPAWGGRKIQAVLQQRGVSSIPSPSTITAILKRHGRLDPTEAVKHKPWKRFEYDEPNALWQMDFKGDFKLSSQGRCYPLTVLDDHSRFSVGLRACGNQQRRTVQEHLTDLFKRYGLPDRILTDNGNPWGSQGQSTYTGLSVWLIRLGIRPINSRVLHPQTLGKDERFHRTLKAEVIRYQEWRDVQHCQGVFDQWRDVYNLERPHQALGMAVPASRYRPSRRPFPATLPAIEYGPDDTIRQVHSNGAIGFRMRRWRIGEAFRGLHVALRPTSVDGIFDVFFCAQRIRKLDLHQDEN